MDSLSPLIESAAYWLTVDAHLRIYTRVIGGVVALSASAALVCMIVWMVKDIAKKGSSDG